jgi:hypothetical protein
MAIQRELRVLVATDGSRDAQEAIATTMHFPWPARTSVRVISVRRTGAEYRRSILLTALDRGAEKAAESTRRTLSRRWPDVEIEVLDKTPVEGILGEAERFRADVIVDRWHRRFEQRRQERDAPRVCGVEREVVRVLLFDPRRPQRRQRALVLDHDIRNWPSRITG